jgi:hypothetical protein
MMLSRQALFASSGERACRRMRSGEMSNFLAPFGRLAGGDRGTLDKTPKIWYAMLEWGVTHPRCNKHGDVGPAHVAKRMAHFGERNVYGTPCASETGRDLPS